MSGADNHHDDLLSEALYTDLVLANVRSVSLEDQMERTALVLANPFHRLAILDAMGLDVIPGDYWDGESAPGIRPEDDWFVLPPVFEDHGVPVLVVRPRGVVE